MRLVLLLFVWLVLPGLAMAGLQIVDGPPPAEETPAAVSVVTIPSHVGGVVVAPTAPTHLVLHNTGGVPVRCRALDSPTWAVVWLQPGEARIITDARRLLAWVCAGEE